MRKQKKPKSIVEAARRYVGTPFVHGGSSVAGMDCIGLLIAVARDLGLADYEPENYSRYFDGEHLRAEIERFCVPVDSPQPGDLILFRMRVQPTHMGIYTDRNTIIHAYNQRLGVVENGYQQPWIKRTVGVYRFRVPQ